MDTPLASFGPALGLLLLMGLLAWALHWVKKRTAPVGSGQGATLRVVSQIMVGPQQRVLVVEVDGPQGPVQLTLGVTPQHVRTLHTQVIGKTALNTTATTLPTPSYSEVAAALQHPPGVERP
jgi:flagellar protein FliO/FliZ